MASRANWSLSDAAERGDVAGIAAALLAGADPNAFEGSQGWGPLLRAAWNDHVAAIAALLAAGARVDGANSIGITALMSAAANDRAVAIDALLAAGADVNRADSDGDTALHGASIKGNLHTARALVEAGARTELSNKFGRRPIDLVRPPLARPLRLRVRATAPLPCSCAQVWAKDEALEAAVTGLLVAAAPWSRRRPVAVACYGMDWEWEA
jgi:ankyrin repeat protein